jgi:hypothetical protein
VGQLLDSRSKPLQRSAIPLGSRINLGAVYLSQIMEPVKVIERLKSEFLRRSWWDDNLQFVLAGYCFPVASTPCSGFDFGRLLFERTPCGFSQRLRRFYIDPNSS